MLCASCGKLLTDFEQYPGQVVTCPHCSGTAPVPAVQPGTTLASKKQATPMDGARVIHAILLAVTASVTGAFCAGAVGNWRPETDPTSPHWVSKGLFMGSLVHLFVSAIAFFPVILLFCGACWVLGICDNSTVNGEGQQTPPTDRWFFDPDASAPPSLLVEFLSTIGLSVLVGGWSGVIGGCFDPLAGGFSGTHLPPRITAGVIGAAFGFAVGCLPWKLYYGLGYTGYCGIMCIPIGCLITVVGSAPIRWAFAIEGETGLMVMASCLLLFNFLFMFGAAWKLSTKNDQAFVRKGKIQASWIALALLAWLAQALVILSPFYISTK